MRRRRAAIASSGGATRNGRIASASCEFALVTDMWISFARLAVDVGVAVPGRAGPPHLLFRGRPVPVRSQERGQRGQQILGSLLSDPVAAAGDDQGLHIV